MAPVGFAIVGSGRIGRVHFDNTAGNPRCSLRYVVDVDLAAAEALASKVVGCQAVASIEEALKDDAVEAVIVCAPTVYHVQIIKQSLNAKKNVMCEKPVSLDPQQVKECYQLAKDVDRTLICGFQRRFDPSFGQVRDRVKDGAIGRVLVIRSTSRDSPFPPLEFLKTSGGVFHDCGSHDIDLVRWVVGENPVEVYAIAHSVVDCVKALDDSDQVIMTFKFPGGVLATIDLSRISAYGYDQRLEVHGDKGMIQSNNVSDHAVTYHTAPGATVPPPCYSFPQRFKIAYQQEVNHFVDLIRGTVDEKNLTRHVTLKDVLDVSAIAHAAHESHLTGKPVKVVYDGDVGEDGRKKRKIGE
eukprot:TRINITY_DN12928_c0_g1_i1.p1 TRINITY_DN12928_c0_g1~~TRINITY_DN12928_c0_g1_i1.p1  ORF type:complete len:355 (-),score=94.39 TRINITY_DN12928_c0_g1_i1:32-1096(-)